MILKAMVGLLLMHHFSYVDCIPFISHNMIQIACLWKGKLMLICISFLNHDRSYHLIHHVGIIGLVLLYTLILFILILIVFGKLCHTLTVILCWDIDIHDIV